MDKSHLIPEAPRRQRASSKASTTASHILDHSSQQLHPADGMDIAVQHGRLPAKLVLCFDGTGNKFRGDESDSNILKIFRCLDREAAGQYHYYQPGIGTYVVSKSVSHTGRWARCKSWYLKAKDSAIGTSFAEHVVGGYKFLMRFYNPGDEIYIFGFSRGSYVARFLAEMIDYVGLLSHGNDELIGFAWKAFSQWQSRPSGGSEVRKHERHKMFKFMKDFRETFSRPVNPVRFMGLFDTVNSVPHFETAWMQRSKFPYTAKTTAKVIRHCVSIDERRAKFRQDLMYQGHGKGHKRPELNDMEHDRFRARRPAISGMSRGAGEEERGRQPTLETEEFAFRPRSRSARADMPRSSDGGSASGDGRSLASQALYNPDDEEQDIDEIWFAGGHADIGGGWEFVPGTKSASHVPLVYMIREAQKAGLPFDPVKLVDMGISEDVTPSSDGGIDRPSAQAASSDNAQVPDIRVDPSTPMTETGPKNWDHFKQRSSREEERHPHRPFHEMLHRAHLARIHDSLEFSSGLRRPQVLSWKIMEFLPFRRMDLRPDGSWQPIRWPLPCGETRDIPHTARVHGSVIRRMKMDESYRPGNLIIGGGGRGVRVAPKEYGIGEWECVQGLGDPIEEVWVKKTPSPKEV
ncbi:hypothetical protein GGR56DRAFT_667300 [Xylariaceae sp. FL0804]|nr:hypothetical protein GGR56DRAFT_667300 [Xylariaceae sp. FL0804]